MIMTRMPVIMAGHSVTVTQAARRNLKCVDNLMMPVPPECHSHPGPAVTVGSSSSHRDGCHASDHRPGRRGSTVTIIGLMFNGYPKSSQVQVAAHHDDTVSQAIRGKSANFKLNSESESAQPVAKANLNRKFRFN